MRVIQSCCDVEARYRRNRVDHLPNRHGLRQINGGRIASTVRNGDTPWLYPLPLPQTGERCGAVDCWLEIGNQELRWLPR